MPSPCNAAIARRQSLQWPREKAAKEANMEEEKEKEQQLQEAKQVEDSSVNVGSAGYSDTRAETAQRIRTPEENKERVVKPRERGLTRWRRAKSMPGSVSVVLTASLEPHRHGRWTTSWRPAILLAVHPWQMLLCNLKPTTNCLLSHRHARPTKRRMRHTRLLNANEKWSMESNSQ